MSDQRKKIRPGSRLSHRRLGVSARVMTISEGWVMVRNHSAMPHLVHIRDLHLEYEVTKW